MSSLYLYFFKQYKNIWKNLSLRIRIEIIILFIIYFTFFSTRLIKFVEEQLVEPGTTEFGLSQFILHILILMISMSIPLVHLNLIPKQKGMVYYRTLPLNKANTIWLLSFLHFKYQLIGLAVVLPIFIAFLIQTSIFNSFYFLVCMLLFLIILILFISNLAVNAKSKSGTLVKYFSFLLIFFGGYFSLYFFTDYYFLFDPLFFIVSLTYLIPSWGGSWHKWDVFIKSNQKKSGHTRNQTGLLSYPVFKKFWFPKITPLLAKEMLNYLRNRKFIRMQIFSFIIYGLLLLVLHFKADENFIIYSAVLTCLYIWQHFSLQFNEKYIKADSEVFIKTLPFKYYQLWFAKFISEFIFVLMLLIVQTILNILKGFQFFEIYQSLIAIFLFSLIVLAAIINFKIIFFDRPRFAGYAYHFFIIFVSVMSVNYYLVGPAIALILLIYFTYYSYREFAR